MQFNAIELFDRSPAHIINKFILLSYLMSLFYEIKSKKLIILHLEILNLIKNACKS